MDTTKNIDKLINDHILHIINSEKHFSRIYEQLDKIEEHLYSKNNDSYLDTLIPIKQISRKLGISQRKLLDLRKRGEISVVAIGGKLFITQKEINRYISSHEFTCKSNKS